MVCDGASDHQIIGYKLMDDIHTNFLLAQTILAMPVMHQYQWGNYKHFLMNVFIIIVIAYGF